MDLNKIGNLIKSKRKELNLTQEELASKLNITEKAISRWETGRGTPDISLLIPLSKTLGISVSELLNGKEDKQEEKNIKDIIKYIDTTNKKKNRFIIPICIVIYIILLVLYLNYLRVEYSSVTFRFDYMGEIVVFLFFALIIGFNNSLISNYYYDKVEDKNKMKKITYIIALVLYTITLINLTNYGRRLFPYTTYNLIPFKTLLGYWAFFDSRTFMVNVIGNIFILMPMQYLILRVFNIKKFSINILISVLIGFFLELFQFITKRGVFDVDDIILYVLGTSLMYFLYDLVINKRKVNINKKHLIIGFISAIITFILFEALSWYYFGDIPTIRVFLRLIIFFSILYLIIIKSYNFIIKKKKK
jgi:transcriptional regulator with XRE-family HTH domain/glycopeptide antibiotics resistance protein